MPTETNRAVLLLAINNVNGADCKMSADRRKPQRLLTVKEAAAILKVCEKTVRRFIERRELRASKLSNGVVRIDEDDLMDFIRDRRTQSSPILSMC